MKIAITGMIASGKSEILSELGRLGWLTLSADVLAWQAAGSLEAKTFLKETFGKESPSREEIRKRFIGDEKFKSGWEAILHPKVNAEWRGFVAENTRSNIVIEIPLLFEKKLEKDFNKVVVCVCDTDLAHERWQMKGRPKEDYPAFAGFLLPIEAKLKSANFILENNTTLIDLRCRVHELHEKILRQ